MDDTWESQNPDERLRAIAQLSSSGNKGQQALIQIALYDPHDAVRLGAVKHVNDLDVLIELQGRKGLLQEIAAQQYLRVLAGNQASPIAESQRLAAIRGLPRKALKQVALLAKCKAAGREAINLISEPEELMDLSLFAVSVHVRKNAALKISDKQLLEELREKVKNKDKTVFKVVDRRISEQIELPRQQDRARQSTKTPKRKNLKPKEVVEKPEVALAKITPGSESKAEVALIDAPKPAIKRSDHEGSKTKDAEIPDLKTSEPKSIEPETISPETQVPKLEQELSKTSYKNTGRLNSLRMSVNNLRRAVSEASDNLKEKTNSMHNTLLELQEKNKAHQEHLKEVTESLLLLLEKALEDGKSYDALPAWDRIQGNISNTSGKLKASLQKQANEYKDKLNELRDWKMYAATEKKKGLVEQMQHLLDSKMHAKDKSRHIGNMHKEWKALGPSSQNESLWRKFKKLSDKAYEPCKEYFKQRKQFMASNLKKRREICENLETELENLATENLNISNLNMLLRDTDIEWKRFAPIEHAKIKSIQKRYYGLVNQYRKLRRNALRTNSKQKQDYIKQAQSLAASEDNKTAMSEAKRLQQEWKNLGPTSYNEDKKFWEDFRAACDKIFEKRNRRNEAARKDSQQAQKSLEIILHSMDAVFVLDDTSFRKSRTDYQDLVQQFATAMDPRIKNQRERLLDRFNGLKRKIDARFDTLPNKKHLQLKNALLAKTKFLEQIEGKLLGSKDDQQFTEIKNQVDHEAWEEIESTGNPQYEEALRERLQKTIDAASIEELRSMAQECEVRVRSLCIDLEIRANIDTPVEDQALRMQIQLNQLKNGFGQSRPDHKENLKYAMDAELKSFCIGPINAKAQKQLSQRLVGAIKKLM